MIHYISGKLDSVTGEYAVIDCSGVGFRIGVSVSTASKLAPDIGKQVRLYTYMSVTENDISLYGFYDEDELELFVQLKSVSGIGPKTAVAILGTLSPSDLRSAVASNDAKLIAQAPGVGLKTAQMLIIKLKDKVGGIEFAPQSKAGAPAKGEKMRQVVDTLTLYGFRREKVIEALKR
ncbi:MAG: Holliday junction branch migration protein RuvA, partial [Clostridia bacterium]|nr:Holliday junction branch migration protein RuvA [Clostridia bacterium]